MVFRLSQYFIQKAAFIQKLLRKVAVECWAFVREHLRGILDACVDGKIDIASEKLYTKSIMVRVIKRINNLAVFV